MEHFTCGRGSIFVRIDRAAAWVLLLVVAALGAGSLGADTGASEQAEQARSLQEQITALQEAEKQRQESARRAAERLKLSGHIQAEGIRDTGEGANLTEQRVRRARLKLDARPVPTASLTLQVDLAREVELRDAYVDLQAGSRASVRAGQFKVPFSHHILVSSTVRVAPERALVSTRLFPGERDRGILGTLALHRSPRIPAALQLGVFEGAGPDTRDNNNDKDLLATLHLGGSRFATRISYYRGTFTNPAVPPAPARRVDKDRFGVDAQFVTPSWVLEGLWACGKGDAVGNTVTATDVEGWYAQATFKPARLALFPYLRYQSYDPDRDASGTTIRGLLLGAAYDASSAVRYTLAWERLGDSARPGNRDIITARAQVKY